MGKHQTWRKLVKKLRRKRKRQSEAKKRDEILLEEQKRREALPEYQQWLAEQKKQEQEKIEEENRQAALMEEQWRKNEDEAQKQWRFVQHKLALAREEKIKQNIRIKLEWEKEQEKLMELKRIKEKELEEQRQIQEEREKLLLDFVEHGGTTPEHLKISLESNPGKPSCRFFEKVSACRFYESCSRNHIRPGISNIILIKNFFTDISLETRENEHGSDCSLEFESEEIYKRYKEFFYDVVSELETSGNIRKIITSCNHEAHLRGNVYVEYSCTRDALVSYHKFNGRWYAGKQLNVEFCDIKCWNSAICGLSYNRSCPKGNACNFLHVFINPKFLYAVQRDCSGSSRSKRSSRSQQKSKNGWESPSYSNTDTQNRKHWRWSESPESSPKRNGNYNNDRHNNHDKNLESNCKRKHHRHRKTHRTSDRNKTKSRSRSPFSNNKTLNKLNKNELFS